MLAQDRTAFYLAAVGLGSNAVALSLPQLWPHFPWWVSYSILCAGIILIVLGFILSIHEHIIKVYLSPRGKRRIYLVVLILIVGGAVAYHQMRPSNRPLSLLELYISAPGSWRDPPGGSPAQVRGSARLVASVASCKATTMAKRTQRSCGVGY